MMSARVLSLETPFAYWQIEKMIKIVTLIDWLIDLHIVLTYVCWHCFLVFNIWVSHALEMTIFFITQPLSCFVFHLPNLLVTQNFVYPTLFSSVPPHAINNDQSLTMHVYPNPPCQLSLWEETGALGENPRLKIIYSKTYKQTWN
jgi:hypothetical protein